MIVFKDEFFDHQWLRTASHASYGGAEIGECLAAAKAIGTEDARRWFDVWANLGKRLFDAAEASAAGGHLASARDAYLRASNYWRAAWTFSFEAPLNSRVATAYRNHRRAFERAIALMSPKGEIIRIPYDGKSLHGYFFKGVGGGKSLPTLIVNGGYDSTAEEAYLFSGVAAVERGYNCLVFDGPGQGEAIIENGMVFRPDWENVIGPVIDYLLTRPEVDPRKIALMGISFGGYLAPRAASVDARIAALVADPGQLSIFEEMKTRMPPFIAKRISDTSGIIPRLLGYILRRRLRHISKGWALRRGLLVHDVAGPLDYLRLTADYAIKNPEAIRCPTLICRAENDDIGATARSLYDALACPKAFLEFASKDGAGDHCESGARRWFNERVFDWLDATLNLASQRLPSS